MSSGRFGNGEAKRRGFLTCYLLLCMSMTFEVHADPAAGDSVRGRRLFAQCTSCHTTATDGPTKIGPNLHGLFGRKAGSFPNFEYSAAMRSSGIVWDEHILDEYLKQPSALVPANKMVFAGVPGAQDRVDIIAYLKEATN